MELLLDWFEYFQENPLALVGVGVGVAVLYYVLNRKPKMVREADRHLKSLLKDGDDQYKQGRRPH